MSRLCLDCGVKEHLCVCDLEVLEQRLTLEDWIPVFEDTPQRCLACFFLTCRCKDGLDNKRKVNNE